MESLLVPQTTVNAVCFFLPAFAKSSLGSILYMLHSVMRFIKLGLESLPDSSRGI